MKYLILLYEERTFLHAMNDEQLLRIIDKKAIDKNCTRKEALCYFDIFRVMKWFPAVHLKKKRNGKWIKKLKSTERTWVDDIPVIERR